MICGLPTNHLLCKTQLQCCVCYVIRKNLPDKSYKSYYISKSSYTSFCAISLKVILYRKNDEFMSNILENSFKVLQTLSRLRVNKKPG